MKKLRYTTNMYRYLAWRLFREMYGVVEWYEEEEERITALTDEAGEKLTEEERKIVESRAIRMRDEYEDWMTERSMREYKNEWDDIDDGLFFTPIEYNEQFYKIWKQGVAKRQTVKMKYESPESGISLRLVDPYKSRAPYGEGYCHARKEVRKFRFDRVIDIALTDQKFEKK